MKYKQLSFIIVILFFITCNQSKISPPNFDAERAFSYLEKQVEFGPRVPGSQESANCRDYFYQHFQTCGLSIDSQNFIFFDPYSQSNIPMVNVIASYESESLEPGIILMAHYDCRPRTDYTQDSLKKDQPIDGANDGASGVAVLMELANSIKMLNPEISIDIVLVDGEDWGKSGHHQFYMLGSKEFARKGIRGKYRFGIVVDMVGDKDLNIYREVYSENSAKPLNDLIFNTAKQMGLNGFIDTLKYSVQDDHLSLITAGIPSVDIIDFDYKYWHTEFDTVDKCSPNSLEQVGRVVAEIIYNKSLWQKIK